MSSPLTIVSTEDLTIQLSDLPPHWCLLARCSASLAYYWRLNLKCNVTRFERNPPFPALNWEVVFSHYHLSMTEPLSSIFISQLRNPETDILKFGFTDNDENPVFLDFFRSYSNVHKPADWTFETMKIHFDCICSSPSKSVLCVINSLTFPLWNVEDPFKFLAQANAFDKPTISPRLRHDLKLLTGPEVSSVAIVKVDQIWDVTLMAPPDGTECILRFEFGGEYPFRPPKLSFQQSSLDKSVADDIFCLVLHEWSPFTTVFTVCLNVVALIYESVHSLPASASAPLPLSSGVNSATRLTRASVKKHVFPVGEDREDPQLKKMKGN